MKTTCIGTIFSGDEELHKAGTFQAFSSPTNTVFHFYLGIIAWSKYDFVSESVGEWTDHILCLQTLRLPAVSWTHDQYFYCPVLSLVGWPIYAMLYNDWKRTKPHVTLTFAMDFFGGLVIVMNNFWLSSFNLWSIQFDILWWQVFIFYISSCLLSVESYRSLQSWRRDHYSNKKNKAQTFFISVCVVLFMDRLWILLHFFTLC